MNRTCTYRKAKGRGDCCTALCTVYSPEYCNSHRRYASELQHHIHNSFVHTNIDKLDTSNWYHFVAHMLSLDIPSNTIEEALRYLCSALDLWEIARPIMSIYCAMKKADIAHNLVTHARHLYSIQGNPKKLAALVRIQKCWREHHGDVTQRVRGPWPARSAVNDTDPFTLEPLESFPPQSIFSFCDPDTQSVFAFHAPELECAIRHANGQAINPFTRTPIPSADITRLHQMMKNIPKKMLPFTPDTWASRNQVFQDICAEYQRLFGIYMLPEWFLCLREDDIEYIFYTYKIRTLNGSQHMRLSLLRRPPCKPWGEHVYVLGHEMWRLSQDSAHPRHMWWMCMLLITIAEVSHDMTLPSWIFDSVMA